MKLIRAVVADDEKIARRGLSDLIADESGIECVGESADGPSTVKVIETLEPDLVFLDIQMPGFFGTDVVTKLTVRPHIVFTTAFAEYAVAAFELNALDYLLKPFGRDRFRQTLERVRAAIRTPSSDSSLARAVEALESKPIERIFVRQAGAIIPVPVEEILRFESRGDYVAIHTSKTHHTVHVTMTHLEQHLDPKRFVRIHRTHIVNLDYVSAFKPHDSNRLAAYLKDGSKLLVSRSKSQELRRLGV